MTQTSTSTFTKTNARHIASKIAADLRQMSKFYGEPSESDIGDYIDEITDLLAAGYLKTFEDGFAIGDERVVSVKYEIRSDGTLKDENSGRVYPHADTSGASHFNFVTYTDAFNNLPQEERKQFKEKLSVQRTHGTEKSDGSGSWNHDKSYASGGVGASRGVFRPS